MHASLDFAHLNPFASNADAHTDAVANPTGCERAVLNLINAAADYAQCYRRRYGEVIGASSRDVRSHWLQMVWNLRELLHEETGRLDAASLRAEVDALLNKHYGKA